MTKRDGLQRVPVPASIKQLQATPAEVGPNGIVMFKDTPGSRALMTCLTDPKALAQWAKLRRLHLPEQRHPAERVPGRPDRKPQPSMMIAAGKANLLVGDASDLMPTSVRQRLRIHRSCRSGSRTREA